MPLKNQNTEKSLVIQLRTGSQTAFHKLYELYHQDIYAYSISLVKSKPHAKDIVQEVFIKVWLKREQLDPELSFKSFIFTITRNLAFNSLTKAANHHKLQETIFYESQKKSRPADQKLMEEHYKKLKQRAIAKLTPRCKLVFEMSREEGKSHQEISQELGVSVNTVKNQMTTALGTIRNFLATHGGISFLLLFLVELSSF